MFGLTKEEKAAQEQLSALNALFGEEAKADGFDLKKEVGQLLALRAGVQKVGSLFGDTANEEGFDLRSAVQSLQKENSAVRNALGVDADGDIETAVKEAVADAETLSKVKAVYGDAAAAEGFDVVDAAQADRDIIVKTDGAERTNANKEKNDHNDTVAKDFRSQADEDLEKAYADMNGTETPENK